MIIEINIQELFTAKLTKEGLRFIKVIFESGKYMAHVKRIGSSWQLTLPLSDLLRISNRGFSAMNTDMFVNNKIYYFEKEKE